MGNGYTGALNASTMSLTAVQVVGLTSSVRAMGLGWKHTCALLNTNGVKCWGANGEGAAGCGWGRLLDGQLAACRGPARGCRRMPALPSFMHAPHQPWRVWPPCRMTPADRAQLGRGTNGTAPTTVPGDVVQTWGSARVVALATGSIHSCVLLSPEDGGRIFCW